MSRHAAPQPALKEINVIVIGSFAWSMVGTVHEALLGLWNDHDQPHVNLITSGCPRGAEEIARNLATSQGWSHVVLRDEDLVHLPSALVLAFLKDSSEDASDLLAEMSSRFWTRIFRDNTVKQVSRWLTR